MTNPEAREAVGDLSETVGHDVIKAITRVADLAATVVNEDGSKLAARVYIAMSGAATAPMVLMGLITKRSELKPSMSSQTVAERSLFAALVSWFAEEPERKTRNAALPDDGTNPHLRECVSESIRVWESATGKKFDPSWLMRGFIPSDVEG